MKRADYFASLEKALSFMREHARAEAIADMAELYDELLERGVSSEAVQERIGTPEAVAREYRFAERLDSVDRSPGVGASLRIGIATLSGTVARGAAVQLLGLLWLGLAVCVIGAAAIAVAGLAFGAAAAAEYLPVVATLAVPGIPQISGVVLGAAALAAGLALLAGSRFAMRLLARLMRAAVSGHSGSGHSAGAAARSGRRAWQLAAVALVLGVFAAALMLFVPAEEYRVAVDERAVLELEPAERLEIAARKVDVVFSVGEEATAHLSGELRRTFLQHFGLHVRAESGTVRVDARYEEGLSWGINPQPTLQITVPPSLSLPIEISLREADVDLGSLPEALRARVTVKR